MRPRSTRDLGLEGEPEEDSFDDLILHVDGYLCELKDAQIRGGLHTLGQSPQGEVLVELVLAITRLAHGRIPSLRATVAESLGLDLAEATSLDRVEEACRTMVEAAQARHWVIDPSDPPTLQWICTWLVPRLAQTTDEIDNLLRGLNGRYVPAGPSGACRPEGGRTSCPPVETSTRWTRNPFPPN